MKVLLVLLMFTCVFLVISHFQSIVSITSDFIRTFITWVCNGIKLVFLYLLIFIQYPLLDDTECARCPTSYYCFGDGLKHKCGCNPNTTDCSGRNDTTFHSFGAWDHCETCPHGWICHDGYALPCPPATHAKCNYTVSYIAKFRYLE